MKNHDETVTTEYGLEPVGNTVYWQGAGTPEYEKQGSQIGEAPAEDESPGSKNTPKREVKLRRLRDKTPTQILQMIRAEIDDLKEEARLAKKAIARMQREEKREDERAKVAMLVKLAKLHSVEEIETMLAASDMNR